MNNNQIEKVVFWLPRVALLLYAFYPLVENDEALGMPYALTIIVLFVMFFLGGVSLFSRNPKVTILSVLKSSTRECMIDLFIGILGLTLSLYANKGFPDAIWILLIIISLLPLFSKQR